MCKHLFCFKLLPVFFLFVSCSKGYDVRVSNYYTERLDSVIIGENTLVFVGIDPEATTGFAHLMKGRHGVAFISKTKNKFYSNITIPKDGTGKRTIQIDGLGQISILEE